MDITQVLMLTLGHNASAIFYNLKTNEVIGYEQERLTRIKGDSQFPADAILEITKHVKIDREHCEAYISHWFPVTDDDGKTCNFNKYYTEENDKFLDSFCFRKRFSNRQFTHHDAHAYSAMFFRHYIVNKKNTFKDSVLSVNKDVYTIVADGFGNNREVLSIYKGNERIETRIGYGQSLGLMYQYATSFVGMKENQDEYKFLGYESHITKYIDVCTLEDEIGRIVKMLIDDGYEKELATDDFATEMKALDNVRMYWYKQFNSVLAKYKLTTLGAEDMKFAHRCIIARLVQTVVERVMLHYIMKYEMQNVNVAGGVFYNVKLNNAVLKAINGTFCAIPLAGDQGAAIGMACAYNPVMLEHGFAFGDLCYGKRSFYNAEKILAKHERAYFVPKNTHIEERLERIASLLANGEIVNIVGPNMEFGPRALCMTSTLFLPTAENTAANNHMNGRNEVMPCAPVCDEANALRMFNSSELARVIGSDAYMICTHEYNKNVPATNFRKGAMHRMPCSVTRYTGRPQIVDERCWHMYYLLHRVEEISGISPMFLVNTSFNVHGQPIVFDLHAIVENYKYQCEHAYTHKVPYLFVFEEL